MKGDIMIRPFLLVALAAGALATAAAAPAWGSEGAGPPGGTFYAFGQTFRSVITPTTIPDQGAFDTLYTFPGTSFAPVSDAAPGFGNYNGGRWKVVQVLGATQQFTSAADILASGLTLVQTSVRFVCPLIRA